MLREKISPRRAAESRLPHPERCRVPSNDTLRNQIFVLDMQGSVLQIIGKKGTGEVEFNYPTEMRLSGEPLRLRDATDAAAHGIGMVFQEQSLLLNLSVAENMFMGRLPGRFGFVDDDQLRAQTIERLNFFYRAYGLGGGGGGGGK